MSRRMAQTFKSLDSMRAEVSTITNAMLAQNGINVVDSFKGTKGSDAYLLLSPEERQNVAEGSRMMSEKGIPFVYDVSLTASEVSKRTEVREAADGSRYLRLLMEGSTS